MNIELPEGLETGDEISALVKTLIDAEKRLEELTGGEVDSVSDSAGRTYLFRHALEQLRSSEVEKQIGVLNALPSRIALLDLNGVIISVNNAWRRFATSGAPNAEVGVGENYLKVCDIAAGCELTSPHVVSDGIRSVLGGQSENFSVEYACATANGTRWFLLSASPLAGKRRKRGLVMHLDITERQTSDEEFKSLTRNTARRERLLHSALSSMNDFAQVCDRDGRILFANEPLLDLWGMSLDEAVGKDFQELGYPSELADRFYRQLREVFDTRKDVTDEMPFSSAKGKPGYYEYIFSPILALDGSVDFVVGLTRDISERRRISEETKASEASMALAQRVGNFGSWELDLLEKPGSHSDLVSPILRWSDQMYRIYGLEPGAIEPGWELLFSLIPEGERAGIRDAIASASISAGSFSFSHKIVLPGQGVRFLHQVGQVVSTDIGGRPAHVVGVAHDFTDRITAEKALAESEGRFRVMLQNVDLAARIIDRNGDIEFCNDYLLRLLDQTQDEVVGSNWTARFVHPSGQDGARMSLETMLNDGRPTQRESDVVSNSGARFQILWNSAVVRDESGRICGIASLGVNVTERKNLEGQLLQSQKMESIGSLAGAIAHDFNNLLTGMLGYAELAQFRLPKDSPIQEDLREIRTSAERGSKLVKQLLSFARKEEGDPQVIDAADLVEGLSSLIARLLGARISLRIRHDEEVGRICLDPSHFEQLVVNLVVNARDAMARGGSLTITTSNTVLHAAEVIHEGLLKPGPYVLLSVSDTGSGMTKEIQSRVFDPFFTTKERGRGTGLGLSTCHGIVTNGGGHISVLSEVSAGTTFLIYFPRVEAPVTHPVAQEASVPALNGETVLVVDDQDTVRSVAVEILTLLGYTALSAKNGDTAIQIAAQADQPIDLLLTDVEMPGMTGAELAKAIAVVKPDLKILFMSGYTSDLDLQELAEVQQSFLQKPFSSAQLSRKVWELLNGNP